MMITTAYINLWNNRVGAIAWDQETRLASFEFEPSFLSNPWDVAPLKMPISGADGTIFSFPELRDTSTFKGIPGLLADSMPDKYGNALINTWLSKNGRPTNSLNPVELLCFIGKRGMGALEFEPVEPKVTGGASKIEIDSLVHVVQEILSGRQDFSARLSDDEEKALIAILKVGSSAGGARAKAMIAFNAETGEIRSGQTDAPKGFSQWLLKFDGVADNQLGTSEGFGRVEMAYHFMARVAGIEMTECRLLEENGRAHFMTRRFDREGSKGKLHLQSLCGMSHYDFMDILSFSYEQLFETMRSLLLPYPEAEQMYRRMVFNVMARNCDDHTKNFAFIMDIFGKWKLAPAFDVCHSYRPDSEWVSQHSMSINGKRKDITRNDLITIAKKMNIKKPDVIINQAKDAVSHWDEFASQTQVKTDLRNAIGKTLLLL
jgi:serine/threonine-protein kinase HipA